MGGGGGGNRGQKSNLSEYVHVAYKIKGHAATCYHIFCPPTILLIKILYADREAMIYTISFYNPDFN